MGNYKVVLMFATVFMLLACSEEHDETVSRSKYDAVVAECNSLKEQRQSTLLANEENAEMLNGIFYELNNITGRTNKLQSNLDETPSENRKRMANEIASDLKLIKERLKNIAPKSDDKQLKAVVENLQIVIQEREEQIKELKVIIAQKDQEISQLGDMVSDLGKKLNDADIRERDSDKNRWFGMGEELVNVANLIPSSKGHGNMKNVKRAKVAILRRAVNCFNNAAELGHPKAREKAKQTDAMRRNEELR